MGVDLSISRTGIALPDGRTIAVVPTTTGHHRLREITDQVLWSVRSNSVVLVVVEGLGGSYQGEAARIIPMLHGALINDLLRARVPYMWLPPPSVKKFATGSGTADKTAMAIAALKRLGTEYKTDDECDADWLRVAGHAAYGMAPSGVSRPFSIPALQRRALFFNAKGKPIVWPVVGSLAPAGV